MQTCDTLPPIRETGEPYSQFIAKVLTVQPRPEVLLEDLGYQEIQGIRSRGLKVTNIGQEKDGEWNGKPIAVTERWMSDDLGATVLYVYSDLKRQTNSRSSLVNISRIEPNAALFEVPQDYTIKSTAF